VASRGFAMGDPGVSRYSHEMPWYSFGKT
jgi:hypothetical protein